MKITLNALKSNILLIFDEIENISPGTAASTHWRDGRDSLYFWQIIRSFCQTQAKRYLSICFVGTSPYLIETSKIDGVDNPAYLLATKRFMPNLSFDVTREMVSRLGFFMGLNFSAEAVARLHASYGGHPFFTRQVCSKVHQLTSINRPIDVPLSRIVDAQGQFSGQLESYVSDIICSLKENYPVEFDLLDKMVDGNQHEIAEYMSVMPELVDHLIGYGLVVVRDGIHELAFSAIEGAVKNLRSAGVVSLTTEAQWSTINVRRNNLEQAIRTALYLWSRTVSEAVWLDVLKVNMNSGRHARLPSTEPNLVLSKGNSPLFYTDLIALLKDGRVLPHLSSKRSEIMEQMERVNRLRRDAHANEFSQNQFADLVVDLEELESEFLAP